MKIPGNQLEAKIKRKLEELAKATENEKRFLGEEIIPGKEIISKDFYEMAEAFDTTSLKNIELDILITRQDKFEGWEKTVRVLEAQAQELQKKIIYWKKRKFPPHA